MINLLKCSALIVLIQSIFLFNSCRKDEPAPITSVTDADGNSYNTVIIGTQLWMNENLKTTKYNNGDLIGTTTPANLNLNGESTPKFQWAYEGDENNVLVYGRLYTWYAVTDIRKVCPAGWHIPSDSEWTVLTTFLGGEAGAGGKLKEEGTAHWLTPNTGATNETGFSALPTGSRSGFGIFEDLGAISHFWSSTEKNPGWAINRGIGYTSSEINGLFPSNKYDG